MIIDTLITDRTQADVLLWAQLRDKISSGTASADEISAWFAGIKGAYNASDVNRVSEAEQFLADEFNGFIDDLLDYYDAACAEVGQTMPAELADAGYSSIAINPVKTNWKVNVDIPGYTASISYYLPNIDILRAVIPVDAPATPSSLNGMTFETANTIEIILKAIYDALVAYKNQKKAAIDEAKAAYM